MPGILTNMDLRIFYALLLTILPLSELRVGLPLGILFAIDNKVPIFLVFFTIVLLNILMISFIFYFLDNIHHLLLKNSLYKKFFASFLKRFQKKVDKFEKRYETIGFFALATFVAVPLPGTGAWTGCLLAWLFGLNRKESMVSIAIGVLIAGLLLLLATLGYLWFLI